MVLMTFPALEISKFIRPVYRNSAYKGENCGDGLLSRSIKQDGIASLIFWGIFILFEYHWALSQSVKIV